MENIERLKKIEQFATARENKANEELRLRNEKIAKLKLKIVSMQKEIKEIIEIGNACMTNGISLYPSITEHGGYEKNNFRADGVSHILGFKLPRAGEKITKIGFSGGGACCYEYFYVSAEGKIEFEPRSRDFIGSELYITEKFVEKFDDFKTAFYSYVDKIIK